MVLSQAGYRVFVCNTVTGKITSDLPVSEGNWSQVLNDAGVIGCTLHPRAEETRVVGLRSAIRPQFQSLGIAYNGIILECGPIEKWRYKGGELRIVAKGLWSVFDARKALRGDMLVPKAPVQGSVLRLTGSLGDIARELVRISIQDNPYGGALNIVLPPVQGGDHERNYHGYDLAWIGDRLRELTEVQNGPDIRFVPRFKGDDPTVVEWVMETGTEQQPLLQQRGADWVWDGSAEQSGVIDFDDEQDGSGLGSKGWTPGSGQEREMLLGSALDTTLVDQGYPWRELDEAAKDVEDQAILNGSAERLLDEAQAPWNTISVSVRADAEPALGSYRPGDWAQIIVPEGHPTLDPGQARMRLMEVQGTLSKAVQLALAPIQDTTPPTSGVGQTEVDSDDPAYLPGTWVSQPAGVTWSELPTGSWKEL